MTKSQNSLCTQVAVAVHGRYRSENFYVPNHLQNNVATSTTPIPVNLLPMRLKAFEQSERKVGFHFVTITNLKNGSNHKLHDVVPTIWPSPFLAPEGNMYLRVYQYLILLWKLYPISLRLGTQHWLVPHLRLLAASHLNEPPIEWHWVRSFVVLFYLPVNRIMINWSPYYSDWSSEPNQTQGIVMTTV